MAQLANWYHCSVKTISRASGRSAVAAAAYRLGKNLTDNELVAASRDAVAAAAYRLGVDLDSSETATAKYASRSQGVATWFIVAPEGSPDWTYDPETLWNHAMSKDKRKNSVTAREVELALPSALTPEERQQVAMDFAHDLVDRYGVVVQVAIHKPSKGGDQRNWHAHIMLTTRKMEPEGLGKKTRELDDMKGTGPKEVEWIRERAAILINEALESGGAEERVSHLSYEDLGLNREPTEHLGPDATEMERNGERTEKGDKNRETKERNRARDELEAALEEYAEFEADLQRQLDAEFVEPEAVEPPAPPATPEEAAASLEAATTPYQEQIIEAGEINQDGTGLGWWDWTVTRVQHTYYAVRDFVRDTWRQFVSRDGPDMER